jgi:hypothetical protein
LDSDSFGSSYSSEEEEDEGRKIKASFLKIKNAFSERFKRF